jgi:hypothetical protein
MDEAFARLDDQPANRSKVQVDASLVATLSAQLEAIDRQREHLANLLQSIDFSERSLS